MKTSEGGGGVWMFSGMAQSHVLIEYYNIKVHIRPFLSCMPMKIVWLHALRIIINTVPKTRKCYSTRTKTMLQPVTTKQVNSNIKFTLGNKPCIQSSVVLHYENMQQVCLNPLPQGTGSVNGLIQDIKKC